MDGTSRKDEWVPPPVFILYPKRRRGSFFQFGSSVLITPPDVTYILQGHFEMAGELLPLPHEGEVFTVLNVTECINVLDHERTEWAINPETGSKMRPVRYAFHPHRFTETTLFKIPETARAEIFVVEGLQDPEDEFRYVVEKEGLEGIIFEEVWRS
jgi:hypothetical protein